MKEKSYTSKVVRSKDQKFDFILYINDKPIVQRWFDVKDFNKDSLKSLELREMLGELIGMDGHTGMLTEKLKKDSIEYLWNNYNPYFVQDDMEVNNSYENTHIFKLDILYDKKPIISGEFSGNMFPIGKFTKGGSRYHVNIKDEIFDIISVIREYLSKEEYTLV